MATDMGGDVAILGAGCAGLSLAVRMVEAGMTDRRIVLIDPRTEYRQDRTWCFWNVVPHDFEEAVSHRWSRWTVTAGGHDILSTSATWTYHHIAAHDFYRSALARLERAPNVEMRLGVGVEGVEDRGDRVVVRTTEGKLEAAIAFDSRPEPIPAGAPGRDLTLLQHFGGYHVETSRAVFDPHVVTLMDFDVDQSEGIHFIYVLPFSSSSALVEDTWFTEAGMPPAVYDENIRAYLQRRFGVSSFDIGYRERGAIPMTTAHLPDRSSSRIYCIGLRGGMAKPSTGYTFLAIQRYVAAMVERLKGEALPEPPPVRSAFAQRLDQIFLARLYQDPAGARALFRALFERVPPDVLIRFLSDVGEPRDYLTVMSAVPMLPMARTALGSWRLWMR